MAFTGELTDRLLIRELYGTYADATCRQDLESYLACWHADGVRVSYGDELRGKAALRAAWREIWSSLQRMAFFSEIGAIEVDGDTATARCYCREIMERKDGKRWKVVGVYDDKLIRDGDTWIFLQRRYRVLINEKPD